jgi:hypothetical protein
VKKEMACLCFAFCVSLCTSLYGAKTASGHVLKFEACPISVKEIRCGTRRVLPLHYVLEMLWVRKCQSHDQWMLILLSLHVVQAHPLLKNLKPRFSGLVTVVPLTHSACVVVVRTATPPKRQMFLSFYLPAYPEGPYRVLEEGVVSYTSNFRTRWNTGLNASRDLAFIFTPVSNISKNDY